MPSFFPNIAVVVDERAKLAPTFPPKLTALDTPLVAAIELVTALPSVFATAVPTVRPVLFPTVFARNVKEIIDSSEYDAENKGAYKGSLLTRFNHYVMVLME